MASLKLGNPKYIWFYIIFTLMHLPDALIQSNLCAALCTHFIELSYPNSIFNNCFFIIIIIF